MDPLTPEDVATALESLGVVKGSRVAVAVSGGADSLCLALLAAPSFEVTALTVDHGLRAEAATEAAYVHSLLEGRGIAHVTLAWRGDKPDANIQAAAREARYGLMGDWCRAHGVERLLTAHHMDDQAETLLLRLARGSGVYGLAAMAPVADMPGGGDSPKIVRPLLGIEKARLVATLTAMGVRWIEDPSNEMLAYDRVKARGLLANPPLDGLTPRRLAETAARLRRTRTALEHYEALWLESHVAFEPEGFARLDLAGLGDAPDEILLRGLATICRTVGGGAYVPRFEQLERLHGALSAPGFKGQTLCGVQVLPAADGGVIAVRELAAMPEPRALERSFLWDGRFHVDVEGVLEGLRMAPLGEAGWTELLRLWPQARENSLPFAVKLTLPAVFDRKGLQAVPHLGYKAGSDMTVRLTPKRLSLPKK